MAAGGGRPGTVDCNPGSLWSVIIWENGKEHEAAGTTLGIAMGVGEFSGTGRLLGDMDPVGNA